MTEEITNEVAVDEESSNGHSTPDAALFQNLRKARAEIQPFGNSLTLEVPGYAGLLGIEYKYIDTGVTERIAKKIARELRSVHGEGETLLGSIDTLVAASKQIVVRDDEKAEWRPITQSIIPVKLGDLKLTEILDYQARDAREVVLGLFGSDHAIIRQSVALSQWLSDVTRKVDEDFFMG